jgi:hypothetical protein
MISQSLINSLEVLMKYVELNNLMDVSKNNYNQVIYEYKLNKNSVECQCSEDRSNVCLTKHKHGFIVVLDDGSKSLIGNSCIRKFDSDSQIRKDINILRNTQRRSDKLESIKKYSDNYDKLLNEIKTMSEKVEDVANFKKSFINYLGKEIVMFNRSSSNLKVVGGKIREYVNNNGKTKKETIRANYDLGVISGKNIIDSDRLFVEFNSSKKKFIKGMDNLKSLLENIENNDPSEKEINAYRVQLEEIQIIQQKFEEISSNWELFKSNKPENLVFAYQKPHQLVKYFLKSKDAGVKYFCQQVESKLKEDRNLDFINIKL